MRLFLCLMACLFTLSAATAKGGAEIVELAMSPALKEQCKAEGGCELWSNERLQRELAEVYQDGVRHGVNKGRKDCGRAS